MAQSNLEDFSKELQSLVSEASHSVLMVGAEEGAARSGFLIREDLLVSVAQSAEPGEKVSVYSTESLAGKDGAEPVYAEVVGFDATSGIGILKIANLPAQPMPLDEHAKADIPALGALSVSVALPSSDGVEARLGMVRCVGGETRLPGGRSVSGYIQTDAHAFPGFLGAPLLSAGGDLLGITMMADGSGAGFVLPTAELASIVAELEKKPHIGMGYLGVETKSAELPSGSAAEREAALLVTNVENGSPADKAGIVVGDFLMSLAGQPVFDGESLLDALVAKNENTIEAVLLRGGDKKTIQVTPASRYRRRMAARWMRRRSSGRGNTLG